MLPVNQASGRIVRAVLAVLGIGLGLAYAGLVLFIDLHPDSYLRLTVRHTEAGTMPGLHGWPLVAAVFRDVLPGLAVAAITGLLYMRAVRRGQQRPVGRGGAGGTGGVNFRREARWMMWAMPIWIVVGLLMALIASPLLRWLSSR
jgi:hypothetical protein